MGDVEEFEGPPLQWGGPGGHGEGWPVVGGLNLVGAEGAQVGEQAGETVQRGVVGGAATGYANVPSIQTAASANVSQ